MDKRRKKTIILLIIYYNYRRDLIVKFVRSVLEQPNLLHRGSHQEKKSSIHEKHSLKLCRSSTPLSYGRSGSTRKGFFHIKGSADKRRDVSFLNEMNSSSQCNLK